MKEGKCKKGDKERKRNSRVSVKAECFPICREEVFILHYVCGQEELCNEEQTDKPQAVADNYTQLAFTILLLYSVLSSSVCATVHSRLSLNPK